MIPPVIDLGYATLTRSSGPEHFMNLSQLERDMGRFIDFLIGKAGQEKAKDFLFRWWIRFDDVRWKNFGREEGLFAARVIQQWFGKRIFGVRRILSA
jgi:hypothetical protein